MAVLCVVPGTGQTTESAGAIGALDCVINPSVVADLGSSAPGILASVSVDRSDFVTAGDVIAELESGVESASVELAKTRADSTAEVDLRRVNADYGHRLRKRTKDLFQRNVVSTNDLDERETEARLARIQLRQAVDNQSIAKIELARAEEILKRRTIKSPITGVVMERFKVVGEYIEDQPVARVAQLDPLHVEVIVPVEHLGKVSPGMNAEVWTEIGEGGRWTAEVTRVDKVADVASGTYGVRLALPNPDYQIPAGLRCRMQLVDSAAQPVAVENGPAAVAESPVAEEPVPSPETVSASLALVAPSEADTPPSSEDAPTATGPEPVSAVEEPVPSPETVSASLALFAPSEEDTPPSSEDELTATGSEPVSAVVANEPAVEAEPIEEVAEEAAISEAEQTSDLPTDTGLSSEEPPMTEEEETAEAQVEVAGEEIASPSVVAPVLPEQENSEPVAEVTESTSGTVEGLPACRVAGPYRDEVVATRKVVKLRRAGLSVDIKSIVRGRRVELKIMTPVLEDHAAAEAQIARLKKAGLSDYYLHKMPGGKRRVYLGIYNSKRFADIRLRELSDAGIKAFSRPSKNSGLNYFLVIRGVPDADIEQMVSRLPIAEDDEAERLGFCNKLANR